MKKKGFVILGLCLFALLVAPVLSVAQETEHIIFT